MYSAANVNRYELTKLNIQQKMLSGRYSTEMLKRYWTMNKKGVCLLDQKCSNTPDTLCHILTLCPALDLKRQILFKDWLSRSVGPINGLFRNILSLDPQQLTQFILDPLTNPHVIRLTQEFGDIITQKCCYFTRTFCHSIHKERMNILDP